MAYTLIMEFPYQIVAFIKTQPELGQFIYLRSPIGWLPNVALKRRFTVKRINESELIEQLKGSLQRIKAFDIRLGAEAKPSHMPVKVIKIEPTEDVMGLHRDLYRLVQKVGQSKYPNREDDNFFPHITIEWKGEMVVDADDLINRTFRIKELWLLKDGGDDSRAIAKFELV